MLTPKIQMARWRILGKTLRNPERSSYKSLIFSIDQMKKLKARRGRPITNLFDQIVQDTKNKGYEITFGENLDKLIELASDEKK